MQWPGGVEGAPAGSVCGVTCRLKIEPRPTVSCCYAQADSALAIHSCSAATTLWLTAVNSLSPSLLQILAHWFSTLFSSRSGLYFACMRQELLWFMIAARHETQQVLTKVDVSYTISVAETSAANPCGCRRSDVGRLERRRTGQR
jgi:hypothetical protein